MNVIHKNKKAYFDYEIIEKYEAGIVLIGQEVKSIKKNQIDLKGSYVLPRQNSLYLIGCHVPPYQPLNAVDYLPERERKLILRKKEIQYLIGKSKQKGLTLVPLKVYTRGALIKIEIGVARGKKAPDKRDTIKKRDIDLDLKRSLKE